jgi:predicted phosphoribosyltransferase
LHAPLDVFLVRKLGVPGHQELAMGAIASWGARVLNDDVVRALQIPRHAIELAAARKRRELDRQERRYRARQPAPNVRRRVIILVDDGLATGSTMRAAIAALRQRKPARIVVAVPVGAPEICAEVQQEADEAICAVAPKPFYAVGAWYQDFSQTTDEEVQILLDEAAATFRPVQRDEAAV